MVEEALRNKVVLCSPISLFAILGVIRHAMDNFAIEQASNEILSQIGAFDRQWDRFVKQMDLVGNRLELAQKGFETLRGTRRRALERPLGRIKAIRQQLPLPPKSNGLTMGRSKLKIRWPYLSPSPNETTIRLLDSPDP